MCSVFCFSPVGNSLRGFVLQSLVTLFDSRVFSPYCLFVTVWQLQFVVSQTDRNNYWLSLCCSRAHGCRVASWKGLFVLVAVCCCPLHKLGSREGRVLMLTVWEKIEGKLWTDEREKRQREVVGQNPNERIGCVTIQ